jgi:hypothetical protein
MLLGFAVASQGGARALDVIYRKLSAKEGKGRAEFRLPLLLPASVLLPLGLLLFGWAAEKRWHWIVADIGLFLTAMSMILIMTGVTTYTIDTYTLYAASALAAVVWLRSMCGFAFPLFAPYSTSSLSCSRRFLSFSRCVHLTHYTSSFHSVFRPRLRRWLFSPSRHCDSRRMARSTFPFSPSLFPLPLAVRSADPREARRSAEVDFAICFLYFAVGTE